MGKTTVRKTAWESAPMVSAAILAEQHDLEPRLANLVLVLGILVSFVSVPLINWLL